MELTEQEFKEWSDDLLYIIWDCHISFKNLEALRSYVQKDSDWQPISGFLRHLRTQYYFTLVTQLAKLFCQGEHTLRFTALMNRLTARQVSSFVLACLRGNTFDDIHLRLPQFWKSEQEMRVGVKQLKQDIANQKEVVDRLHRCRNKVIAHTDNFQQRQSVEEAAPTVNELKQLAKLAAKIYNSIQAGLGFGSFSFDTTGSWEIGPVFRGWSGFVELHNLKGELMRMGYAGLIAMDRASFDLKVVPLPTTGD